MHLNAWVPVTDRTRQLCAVCKPRPCNRGASLSCHLFRWESVSYVYKAQKHVVEPCNTCKGYLFIFLGSRDQQVTGCKAWWSSALATLEQLKPWCFGVLNTLKEDREGNWLASCVEVRWWRKTKMTNGALICCYLLLIRSTGSSARRVHQQGTVRRCQVNASHRGKGVKKMVGLCASHLQTLVSSYYIYFHDLSCILFWILPKT